MGSSNKICYRRITTFYKSDFLANSILFNLVSGDHELLSQTATSIADQDITVAGHGDREGT